MAQSTPLQFSLPGAKSESDTAAITQAVRGLDRSASVSVDLATKRVVIGGEAEAHEFIAAIEAAGFEVKAAE